MLFANLKLVFQLAQGDKIGFVVGIILRGELADALLHGGQVHAQEGVDLLFVGKGYGQAGDGLGALLRGDDVGVIGFYVGGEAQVGGGVFVRRIKLNGIGQPENALQAVVQPLRTAIGEHAPAACGKQGVACEQVLVIQQIAAVAGGVPCGVPNAGAVVLPYDAVALVNNVAGLGDVCCAVNRAA